MLYRVLAVLLLLSLPLWAEEEREGGIIGTGIVGTITHLGSIHVNGQHILIDPEMPVTGAVRPMVASDLQPGHTVAVVATQEGNAWQARHIRQVLPLVGPLRREDDGRLTVMGTQVLFDGPAPDHNTWVAVSGLWQGDRVRASRLDTFLVPSIARISGTFMGLDPDGGLTIGTTPVAGFIPRHIAPGDLVQLMGRAVPGGILATRLETGLFDQTPGLMLVEGYYSAPQPDGLYTVLGSGKVAFTTRPEMIDATTRVLHCADAEGLIDPTAGAEHVDAQALRHLGCLR
ncbi:DUF5666 domain-containing protein [Aliiroseovarius sp.]|uniref:DUF5666 domain-containing protein n=1 Tax=Aliiroseovarius sp. TaxID=1872442 RepID=UPI003BAA24FA